MTLYLFLGHYYHIGVLLDCSLLIEVDHEVDHAASGFGFLLDQPHFESGLIIWFIWIFWIFKSLSFFN